MSSQKTFIALFNYGGGMRGLIPAHIMSKIEDATGLRMADMVDIFAGPSTGAILNAALTLRHPDHLARPRYRARHMVRFYEREGLNIFPQDRFREFRGLIHDFNNRTMKLAQLNALFRHGHYNPASLGRALKTLYGESRLADSLSSLIIPVYNIDGGQIHMARERGEADDAPVRTLNNFIDEGGHAVWLKHIRASLPNGGTNKTPDVYLYDAVMASCAAPTYFPCHHFETRWPDRGQEHCTGIDGSIFDNPCISYLGAIRRHVPPDAKLIMIILGTGYTNRSITRDDWNRFGALGVVDPVNDLPLINIFFHASESALMETFAEEVGADLYVFNKSMFNPSDPNMPASQIDDASPENLKKLNHFSEEMLEENRGKFDDVCELLTNNSTHRSQRKQAGKNLWHFLSRQRS